MGARTRKIWRGLGVAVLAGGLSGAALADPASAGARDEGAVTLLTLLGGEGGEGGEGGHGGHGDEEADAFSGAPTDVALTGRLVLLKGHLLVGRELYADGHAVEALPHFLHPTEEIYGRIKAPLAKFKIAPFRKPLEDLAKAARAAKPAPEVLKRIDDLITTVDLAIAKVPSAKSGVEGLEVAAKVLRQAASEFGEALEGQAIKNPIEYQDARGFSAALRGFVQDPAVALSGKAEARAKILGELDALDAFWPTAMPGPETKGAKGDVEAAASRIELAKRLAR